MDYTPVPPPRDPSSKMEMATHVGSKMIRQCSWSGHDTGEPKVYLTLSIGQLSSELVFLSLRCVLSPFKLISQRLHLFTQHCA